MEPSKPLAERAVAIRDARATSLKRRGCDPAFDPDAARGGRGAERARARRLRYGQPPDAEPHVGRPAPRAARAPAASTPEKGREAAPDPGKAAAGGRGAGRAGRGRAGAREGRDRGRRAGKPPVGAPGATARGDGRRGWRRALPVASRRKRREAKAPPATRGGRKPREPAPPEPAAGPPYPAR